MRTPSHRWCWQTGFTLVEMLVSMSIFVLLVVVITQLFNSASAVTIGGNKHMDADSQARLVLDRMAIDFAHIVKRPDVDYYFLKNSGPGNPNDQMAFFSESTGYYPAAVNGDTPKSNVSLVGYRINTANQLERLNKALIWNGVTASTTGASGTGGLLPTDRPMVYLPQTLLGTWPTITGTDSDYQVIGDQVYRMEICYLVKSGTQNATLSDTPYTAPDTSYNGLQDVAAIVVSIAVLDSKSRLLASAASLAASAGKLEDVSGATIAVPPATLWQTDIRNGIQNGTIGLPKSAATQIRVYQRYFYLDQTP